MDDDDFFKKHFSDVIPIKKVDRIRLKKNQNNPDKKYLRKVAEGNSDISQLNSRLEIVSDDYFDPVMPNEIISFKRPGIQDSVFKKFCLGKYEIEGQLDLHGRTVSQAKSDVLNFISEALFLNYKYLLIIHGKNERDLGNPAILKSHTYKWLKEIPEVLACHSAQQRHGGRGAVYVLLKRK
jgi:DNA-nicking Smr family endonuclease